MTGDAATSTGQRKKDIKCIVAQKEAKVNIDEIIADLRQELQNIEDTKAQLTESQERIRDAICQCEMLKEAEQ
jgi:hypothetical protein